MHQPSPVAKFFWVISLLCALAGGGIGFFGFIAANGAPQEAAAAAFGCLVAIAPYVLARSVESLSGSVATTGALAAREPINWKPLVITLVVVAAIGAAYQMSDQILGWVTPSSAYAAFQGQESAWHSRCDAYAKTVAEKDRDLAETCRQDREKLTAYGKEKGWR